MSPVVEDPEVEDPVVDESNPVDKEELVPLPLVVDVSLVLAWMQSAERERNITMDKRQEFIWTDF